MFSSQVTESLTVEQLSHQLKYVSDKIKILLAVTIWLQVIANPIFCWFWKNQLFWHFFFVQLRKRKYEKLKKKFTLYGLYFFFFGWFRFFIWCKLIKSIRFFLVNFKFLSNGFARKDKLVFSRNGKKRFKSLVSSYVQISKKTAKKI